MDPPINRNPTEYDMNMVMLRVTMSATDKRESIVEIDLLQKRLYDELPFTLCL